MKVSGVPTHAMDFQVPLFLYHQQAMDLDVKVHEGLGGPLGSKGTSGLSKKVKVSGEG